MRHFRISIFNDLDTCDEDEVAMFVEEDLPFEFSRWISLSNQYWNISRYLEELNEIYKNSQNRNS